MDPEMAWNELRIDLKTIRARMYVVAAGILILAIDAVAGWINVVIGWIGWLFTPGFIGPNF